MINEQQMPAEDLTRIHDNAECHYPNYLSDIEPDQDKFNAYIRGAKAEYLRHLNSKPSGLRWVNAREIPAKRYFKKPIKIMDGGPEMYSIGSLTLSGDFWDEYNGNAYPPDQIEYLADSTPTLLEEKGETGDPWTAVTHSLPEPHKDCWVVLENDIVAEGLLREDKTWACREPENWNFIYDVTHWRLNLPPAPPSQIPPSAPTVEPGDKNDWRPCSDQPLEYEQVLLWFEGLKTMDVGYMINGSWLKSDKKAFWCEPDMWRQMPESPINK